MTTVSVKWQLWTKFDMLGVSDMLDLSQWTLSNIIPAYSLIKLSLAEGTLTLAGSQPIQLSWNVYWGQVLCLLLTTSFTIALSLNKATFSCISFNTYKKGQQEQRGSISRKSGRKVFHKHFSRPCVVRCVSHRIADSISSVLLLANTWSAAVYRTW